MRTGAPMYRCPRCTGPLVLRSGDFECRNCGAGFRFRNGFADFLIDEPFEDDLEPSALCNEDRTGSFFAARYLVPLLKRLGSDAAGDTKVLSVGCGVGSDVETLCEHGFDCYGIDPGNRSSCWSRRTVGERLAFGHSAHLPFADAAFDFAFMNCVLTHIGVVGDSYEVQNAYDDDRRRAVEEVVRVVKPGGHILAANPNRACPVDLFHLDTGFASRVRFHSPSEPFLLSFRDHEDYFVHRGRCTSIELLPVSNFWGFFSSSKSALGRLAQLPVKTLFSLLSTNLFAPLRRTWMNPWLVVLVEK